MWRVVVAAVVVQIESGIERNLQRRLSKRDTRRGDVAVVGDSRLFSACIGKYDIHFAFKSLLSPHNSSSNKSSCAEDQCVEVGVIVCACA